MANQPATLGQVASLAVSIGVLGGTVEAVFIAFRKLVLNRIAFVSYDFVWMTPLAFVLLFAPAAIVAFLVLRAMRLRPSLRLCAFALIAVATASVLLSYSAILWWTSAVLAIGVAIRAAWAVADAPDLALRRLVKAAAIAAIIVMIGGGGVRAVRAYSDWNSLRSLPPAPSGAPNVLLIVMDTVRAKSLSLYGCERPTTPHLSELARSSVVFDRAFATAPWTLPTHASLLTGLDAVNAGGGWLAPIDVKGPFLAEVLRDRGYLTGAFVSNLLYTSYESGLSRGFGLYDDYHASTALIRAHTSLWRLDLKSDAPQARTASEMLSALVHSRVQVAGPEPADMFRPADQIASAFLDWQKAHADRPFFAFLNLFDAHRPYRAPAEFQQRFARTAKSGEDRYEAAIAWLDHVVGNITVALKDRGILDNTLIIVTSDHGELFGEHGLVDHANALYLPLLRVPLMMRLPSRVPAGVRIGSVVSLRDVGATIVDLTRAGTSMPGTSLAVSWQPGAPAMTGFARSSLAKGRNVSPTHRNANGDMSAVTEGDYHYILNADGTEELFDYVNDPEELRNLAGDPAQGPVLIRMRKVLASGR